MAKRKKKRKQYWYVATFLDVPVTFRYGSVGYIGPYYTKLQARKVMKSYLKEMKGEATTKDFWIEGPFSVRIEKLYFGDM